MAGMPAPAQQNAEEAAASRAHAAKQQKEAISLPARPPLAKRTKTEGMPEENQALELGGSPGAALWVAPTPA
eukprot:374246-Pyramimonas_sp.AAC.1